MVYPLVSLILLGQRFQGILLILAQVRPPLPRACKLTVHLTALFYGNNGTNDLRESTIFDNLAQGGGVIHVEGGESLSLNIEGGSITNNIRGVFCTGSALGIESDVDAYSIFNNTFFDIACGNCGSCLCAPTPVLALPTNDGQGVRTLEFTHDTHCLYVVSELCLPSTTTGPSLDLHHMS